MTGSAIDMIIEDILRREGGFVDDPDDPGGPTRYGITLRTLAEVRGQPVSRDDVRSLGIDEARAILRDRYYILPGIDRLPEALQPFMTDSAVNHGVGAAIRLLQRALAAVAYVSPAIDGRLGPETCSMAEAEYQRLGANLLRTLVEERRRLYFRIAAQRPASAKFLRGWLRRTDEFTPAPEI